MTQASSAALTCCILDIAGTSHLQGSLQAGAIPLYKFLYWKCSALIGSLGALLLANVQRAPACIVTDLELLRLLDVALRKGRKTTLLLRIALSCHKAPQPFAVYTYPPTRPSLGPTKLMRALSQR